MRTSYMHRNTILLVLIISTALLFMISPAVQPMQAAAPAYVPLATTEDLHSKAEQAPNRAMQSIEGLVETTHPGLLAGAHIQAITPDGWVAAETPIGALGRYHLRDLLPGRYLLIVTDQDGQSLTLHGDPSVELISDALGSVLLRDLVVSEGLAPVGTASVASPQATGSGIINGTVRDSVSGQPVVGLEVSLYIAAGSARSYLTTAANGFYSFSNVAPGSYVVRFGNPGTGGSYLTQWYNGVPNRTAATVINITAGQTISNINASLVRAGSISAWVDWGGSLYGPTNYTLVAEAYDQAGYLVGEYSDTRYEYEAMNPFVIDGLSAGSYRLKVAIRPYETDLRYISEYYNNQTSLATADLISVVSNQQNYLGRITLSRGAILRGRVLGVGDSPLSGVSVRAYDTNGVEITRGYTDSSGTYILDDGLASGNYRLQFLPSALGGEAKNYLPQYYLGKPDLASATPLSVTASLVTTADDVRLERMGEIRGTITTASGQALAGVEVSIIDCAGSYRTFTTDAQGSYTTGGLPSGSYNVLFTPSTSYIVEYYQDKTTSSNADPVIVTNGVNTTANAVLDVGGQIGGRVADATTDVALANIYVDVYRVGYGYMTSTTTNSAGIYQTRGLAVGSYQLAFRPPHSGTSSVYISANYGNAASVGTSPTIPVGGPGLVGGKHMMLIRGGQISGSVLGADTSLPLEDISVTIYDQQGDWFDYTDTDAQGRFITPGLPAGAYRLAFEPIGGGRSVSYARRYYRGAPDLATTEAITLSGTGLINAQDTTLLRGGQLGGIVRSAVTQSPLNDASVSIYDSEGQYLDTTYTKTDGSYITSGLAPGEYRLRFNASTSDAPVPCRFVYAAEYYNDKLTLDLADPIPVYEPTFAGGFDAALAITEALYSVYGYARDPFGAGISGVTVTALETGAVSTPSNADGFYRIDGLRAQNYTLRAGRLGYAFSSDQPVSVLVNRGPFNFVGQPAVGYTISGIVRDHYGRPLSNATVRTRDPFTGVPATSLPTGTDGVFSIPTIPPGSYELTAIAADYTFVGIPVTLGFQDRTGVIISGLPIRTPSRTPLIFVPGITGSYLDIVNNLNNVTDDVNVWPGNIGSHPAMSLDPHDPSARADIYASDVIRSVARNIGLEKQVYQPLLSALTLPNRYKEYDQGRGAYARYRARTAGGCHVDQTTATLFVFPYDWRQSSVISAKELRDYVRCIRKIYPGTRVDLLTHSMGGVVARRYMLEYANDDSVERLITIAAPWLGAPKAINTLETGQFLDFQGMIYTSFPNGQLANLVRYFDGAHQLLPSPTYFALGGRPFGERFWDIDQSGNWFPETYETAGKFNRMLDLRFPASLPGTEIASFHTSQQDEGSPGSQAFYIYGEQTADSTIENVTAIPISLCARILPGAPLNDADLICLQGLTGFAVKVGAGDGTVPVLSARRVGNGQNLNSSGTTVIKCVPEPGAKDETVEHTGLTSNENVLKLVWELLQRQAPTRTACAVDQAASRLSVDSEIAQAAPGESPLIYAQLINTPQMVVGDSHGASSADMGGGIGILPEGVSLTTLDRSTKLLLLDAIESYTVTFHTNDQPVLIDVSQGNSESRTQATRYLDLNLPPNITAQLTIVGDHMAELRYDSDGNGSYETLVPPSAAVSGAAANDITPPAVSVGRTGPSDHPTLTISATDAGAGVRAIYYSFDGATFKRYVSPLEIDPASVPMLYVFAEDQVANRSATMVQPTTGLSYFVMLPYIVNAVQP